MAQVTLPSGITLEYERHGSGEPMLLIMGLAGQLIDWPEAFIDRLIGAGFEVIVFDNRDSGLSTMTEHAVPSRRRTILSMVFRRTLRGEGYTLDDMADDTAGLLDALGLDSAHVVGMSMGGMIAQALTLRHPERVRSLCSVMSNTGDRRHGSISPKLVRAMGMPKPPTKEIALAEARKLWSYISGDHFDEAEVTAKMEAAIERSWAPDGIARQTAAIARSKDRTAALSAVRAPTLVVHGLKDLLVAPSGGMTTCSAISGSRLLMFPDMGHNLPEPRQDEIVAAIVTNTLRASALTVG